jgi:hydroxyacylglutathione hydrolase
MYKLSIKFWLSAAFLATLSSGAWSQVAPGSLDVEWSHGAQNCAGVTRPPLQVHEYNPQTFILREDLCSTFEAPFMYLLVGSSRALLIDTGDIADPKQMPLARTVLGLLAKNGSPPVPLLVVHTHRHLDHRAGDAQFQALPNVEVVDYDLGSVQKYFAISNWPKGNAQLDLGDRTVDVLPSPGHNETHLVFYDRNTGLLFSGDFLMPGRLLIDDASADLASAQRVVQFIEDRPVTHVLGGHIEINRQGETLPWNSHYHPDEAPLQMRKEDVMALPEALSAFNGLYTRHGSFVLMNPMRILILMASGAAIVLIAGTTWLFRFWRRRRARAKAPLVVG